MQIENLIDNTISNLKSVIDSDNIIGKPIVNGDLVVIPVSKVSFGFVVGGGEYGEVYQTSNSNLPYANASGAGVNVSPIGFLISDKNQVKFVNILEENEDSKWKDLISAGMKIVKDIKKWF